MQSPTPESIILRDLARRNASAYIDLPVTKALLIIGSSAEGVSDRYSDLDMALYYDALPSHDELLAARSRNGGGELKWVIGDRDEGELIESYEVNGVECQFAHATIEAWERDMSKVLINLEVDSPLQKALSGLLTGIPLYGEELIANWRERAQNYPDALAKAMVEKNLTFFPLWGLEGRVFSRDATLWVHQSLVENSHHILGILAGLNRKYFTTFQFKRMRSFIGELSIAPVSLANRIETLFLEDPKSAATIMESLIAETLNLVNQHMPEVDTTSARKRIGWRQKPWT